jgi:hypothetical protein
MIFHTIKLDLELDGEKLVVKLEDRDGPVTGTSTAWRNAEIKKVAGQLGHTSPDAIDPAIRAVTAALFPGDVQGRIIAILDGLGDDRSWRVRMTLRLHDARLEAVPWELASKPGTLTPLIRDPRFALVRVPDVDSDGHLQLPTPIRVLHATALQITTRQGRPPKNYDWLANGDGAALSGTASDGRLVVEELADVTPRQIELAMRSPADVFHFSGHGEPAGLVVNCGWLGGEVKPRPYKPFVILEAEALADSLRGVPLVILSCCHGAAAGRTDDWSLASQLVRAASVGAVVAMQQNVDDMAAAEFTGAFYKTLVQTGSLDEAVAEGRAAVGARYAIPVVCTRTEDSRAQEDAVERTEEACPMRVAAASRERDAPIGAISAGRRIEIFEPAGSSVRRMGLDGRSGLVAVPVPGDALDVAVTQGGETLVVLGGDRLTLFGIKGVDKPLSKWKQHYRAPTAAAGLLAARQGSQIVRVLTADVEGRTASVACHGLDASGGGVPEPHDDLRAAAATEDSFLMIDTRGDLVDSESRDRDLLARVSLDGWICVDHCTSGGVQLTVAARAADQRTSLVLIADGRISEHPVYVIDVVDGRRKRYPASLEQITIVRPTDGAPPSSILVRTRPGGALYELRADLLHAAGAVELSL